MPVLTTPSWKSDRKIAASTALPQPPSTSHNVPSTSAIALRCRSMGPSMVGRWCHSYVR